VQYPVTEHLGVYADFDAPTRGWADVLDETDELLAEARRQNRRCLHQLDPSAAVREIRAHYERAGRELTDPIEIEVHVADPRGAIGRMRRPGLVVVDHQATLYGAHCYAHVRGPGNHRLLLPRAKADRPLCCVLSPDLHESLGFRRVEHIGDQPGLAVGARSCNGSQLWPPCSINGPARVVAALPPALPGPPGPTRRREPGAGAVHDGGFSPDPCQGSPRSPPHGLDDDCRLRYDDSRRQPASTSDMASTKRPSGTPTPAQYEILELAWAARSDGVTVADVWKAIRSRRPVTRTTVQNLIERLVARGWLARRTAAGSHRFHPTLDQAAADRALARDFLAGFFDRRRLHAFSSLLGAGSFDANELGRLRRLVDTALREAKERES
jgi:predicted transcriptional regulator